MAFHWVSRTQARRTGWRRYWLLRARRYEVSKKLLARRIARSRKLFRHGPDVFVFLWKQADDYVRSRTKLALFCTVLSSALAVVGPLIFKVIVDNVASPGEMAWGLLVAVLFLFALHHFVMRTLSAASGYLTIRADRRMYRVLSVEWHSHIMSLPYRFHSNRKSGGMTEVLNNGLLGYQLLFQQILHSGLPLLIQLLTMCVVMVRLDQPLLLGLFCITLFFYGLTFSYCIARVTAAGRDANDAQVNASAVMVDSIVNYVVVKFFTAEPMIRERFDQALVHSETAWERFARASLWNGVAIGGIFCVFLLTTLWYAAQQTWLGLMTVGTFVMIHTYVNQLVQPIESVGYALQSLMQGFVYVEKMLAVFNETPEAHRADRRLPAEGPGELRFEDVSVGYESDRSVLRAVNLVIPRGKTVALVGPSGAGKSTVVRLLMRLIEPNTGKILLDDVPIAELSLLKLRQSIAVVPQETLLFDESIAYNIGFGKSGSTQEEIEQAARVACIHDFIVSHKDGYEARVGERGVKLSGGQCQRLSIARAVLKRPKVYVFDEATSSLDVESEAHIVANIREVARDSTALIIAHRLSTVAHADHIYVLSDKGSVAEEGTHEELLRAGGRYAAMIQKQSLLDRALDPASV